jgi:hypothetical protein
MKLFLTIFFGLVLLITTDLYFDYVISGDYIVAYLVWLVSIILIALWVVYIIRVFKQITNYLKNKKA